MHIDVYYHTYQYCGILYLFEDEYNGAITQMMSAGQLATITGGYSGTEVTLKDNALATSYDIDGDTATLAFYSYGEGPNRDYGYYAVITGYKEAGEEGVDQLISKSSNISEAGNASGVHDYNLATLDTMTVPGASSIHVELYYHTFENWAMVYIFPESGPTSTPSYQPGSYGQLYSYSGGFASSAIISKDDALHESIDIDDTDTIQIGFYTYVTTSSGPPQDYGYYAIVTGFDESGNQLKAYKTVYAPTPVPILGTTAIQGEYKEPNAGSTSFAFRGWSTDPNATTAEYKNEEEVMNNLIKGEDGISTTLYAVWKTAITLTYDANANNVTGSMDQYNETDLAEDDTITIPYNFYSRTGWTFAFWSTDPNTRYDDSSSESVRLYGGNSFTISDINSLLPDDSRDKKLYAIWQPSYRIIYDGNGDNVEGAMDSVYHGSYSGTVSVSSIGLYASNYSRPGYGFAGWSFDKNATPSNGATIYGPNATITLPSDITQYADESNYIRLYAVWVAAESDVTMQTFDPTDSVYSSLDIGSVIALKDERDDDVYAIAKLADDNWWMIENLRLDPAGKTLDSTNTNNPTSGFTTAASELSSSTFASCAENSSACMDQISVGLGNITGTIVSPTTQNQTTRWYSYGGMYNWYTATAGHGTYSKTTGATDGDICPSGWHLPYGGNGTDFKGGNTDGGIYYLGSKLGATADSEASSNIWRSYPNNFVYSGRYSSSSDSYRGSYGYYWSSTAFSSSSGNILGIIYRSSAYVSTYGHSKYVGQAVRCLAQFPAYDKNATDAEGDMSMLSHANLSVSNEVTLYAPNFSRAGFGFAGWSFDENATVDNGAKIYGPNETLTVTSEMLDGDRLKLLYAVWVPSAGNLQGFSCSTLSNGQVTALKDTRDDSVYTVGKLADGNCWMMENLRLDPAGKTLDSSNTNNPTSTFTSTVSALSNSTFVNCQNNYSDCDDQFSLGLGNITGTTVSPTTQNQTTRWYSYGGMYNWYTATAGHGTYSKTSGATDGDICPSGWHLPYGGNGTGTKGGNTDGGFYYLNYKLNNNLNVTNATASNNLRAYPANFVYSGSYIRSSADNRGSVGLYWSSTPDGVNMGYNLHFASGSVTPGTNNSNKFRGDSVRCVAQ